MQGALPGGLLCREVAAQQRWNKARKHFLSSQIHHQRLTSTRSSCCGSARKPSVPCSIRAAFPSSSCSDVYCCQCVRKSRSLHSSRLQSSAGSLLPACGGRRSRNRRKFRAAAAAGPESAGGEDFGFAASGDVDVNDSRLYGESSVSEGDSSGDANGSVSISDDSYKPGLGERGSFDGEGGGFIAEDGQEYAGDDDEEDSRYGIGLEEEEDEDIGSFQGWKDGVSSDGINWGKHPISDDDMAVLRASNAARMEEMGAGGGESVVDGDPADEVLTVDDLDPDGNYTPWQFVRVSDEKLNHEITVEVRATLESCFSIWADRINYCQWFRIIYEMGVMPSQDPDQNEKYCGLWLRYKWGMMPALEIFTVLEKTLQVMDGDRAAIMEQSVDGFPLIGSVEFERQPDTPDGTPSTHITLQVSYFIPEYLQEFVGSLGTYGDVNDLLAESLLLYAAFCETVDQERLEETRARDRFQASAVSSNLSDTYHRNLKIAEDTLAELEAHPDYAAQAAEAEALGVDLDTGEGLEALLASYDEDDAEGLPRGPVWEGAKDNIDVNNLADVVPLFDDDGGDEPTPAQKLALEYGAKVEEQLQQQREAEAAENEAAVKAATLDTDDSNMWRRSTIVRSGDQTKNKGFPGVGNEVAAAKRRRASNKNASQAD